MKLSYNVLDTFATPMRNPLLVLGKLGILAALLSCVASESTTIDSQLSQVTEETFSLLDLDANGTVSRDEYVEPHLKKAEQGLRINAWMESGGGHIFDNYVPSDSEIKKKRFAKIRFWRWDSNRDDVLSVEEFKNFLNSEDSEVASDQEDLFPELDEDKDGTLSYEEFKKETDRQYLLRYSSKNSRGTDSTTNEVVNQDVADPEEEAIEVSNHALAQEKKRIEKEFDSRDANGDLVLTVDEFMSWQRYIEIHSELMDTSFETMDIDDDASVSLDEFTAGMKTQLHERVAANDKIESETERRDAHSAMEHRLIRSFRNLDSNDDGQVTQTEMKEYQDRTYVTPLTQL